VYQVITLTLTLALTLTLIGGRGDDCQSNNGVAESKRDGRGELNMERIGRILT